jgi:hypothetical protein
MRKFFALTLLLLLAVLYSIASGTSVEARANFSNEPQVNAEQDSHLSATAMDGSAALTHAGPFRNRPMVQKKADNGPSGSSGLEPMGNGTVYDANLGVFWLADANLAGDARVRKMLGADKLNINPDGYGLSDSASMGGLIEQLQQWKGVSGPQQMATSGYART